MSLRSQCALRPWQSALPDYGLASGGSLSFCGERKGGKNAAKTNGFGILFADRRQQDPELSNHANLALQNSRLAFASSLRLHPRRALRLCWPGGTGETSASAVGRREGTPPYGGLIGKRRTGVGLPDDLKPGLHRTSSKKPCHCEGAPRPWQSVILKTNFHHRRS